MFDGENNSENFRLP